MTYLFKLYGIEASKVIGNAPFFDKTALERFCYNNDYPYPFEETNAEIDTQFGNGQAIGEPIKPAPIIDESKIEIIIGLTVGDIRQMIKDNQALGDVLTAVNYWRKLPDERRNFQSCLYSGLNRKAQSNKWGLNDDKSLSKKQYEVIGDVFIQSSQKLTGSKEKRKYPKYEDAMAER